MVLLFLGALNLADVYLWDGGKLNLYIGIIFVVIGLFQLASRLDKTLGL